MSTKNTRTKATLQQRVRSLIAGTRKQHPRRNSRRKTMSSKRTESSSRPEPPFIASYPKYACRRDSAFNQKSKRFPGADGTFDDRGAARAVVAAMAVGAELVSYLAEDGHGRYRKVGPPARARTPRDEVGLGG
jgi:hypothetical protein